MCQILCLTTHNPEDRDKIIASAWNQMKATQRDGYGAVWFGVDGTIGYYKRRYAVVHDDGPKFALPEFIQKKIKPKDDFSASNDIPSDGGFLLIHGRIATNPITLANTHPMISQDNKAAMIHNGCVWSNKYDNINEDCTCDSELLLQAYVAGGMDEVSEHISGYFAFMMLELTADGNKLLHVAKDGRASLYGGKTQNGYAFATNESLLENAGAESMGEVMDHHLIVFKSADDFSISDFPARTYTFVPEYERSRQKREYKNNKEGKKTMHHQYPPLPSTPLNYEAERALIEAEYAEIERQEQEELRYGWRGGV